MGIWHIWYLFLSLTHFCFSRALLAHSTLNVWMIIRSNTFIVNALSLHQFANIYVTHSPINLPASFYFYVLCIVCVSFCVDDLSTKWSIMCAVCTHIQTRSLIVMCPDRPLLFLFFLLFPRFRCNWLWLKNVCITYTLQLTMSTWCVLFFSLPRMQTATWHAYHIVHSRAIR